MARIMTSFTRTMGIQVPVVCAPMAGGSTAKLAAQVAIGGGFAFIPAGYDNVRHLREELATVRSILSSSGQSSLRLPVGVGYFGWKLDADGDAAHAMLDAALQSGVRAVWLSFGSDLGRWADYVRESDKITGRKTLVFIQVNSVDEALNAVNNWHADVVVAQGIEAGGHGGSYAPPVFSLVSSIIAALPPDGQVPVLAAGGITSGAQVAGFLALGAAGAVLGTRFLLTPESAYTGPQKAALLISDTTSTVRSHAFDVARGTLGWPDRVDGRGIRNRLVEDVENGVEISEVQEKLADATKHGMSDYMVIYAGTGAAELKDIVDAQEVIQELYQGIVSRLRESRGIVIEPKPVEPEPEYDNW